MSRLAEKVNASNAELVVVTLVGAPLDVTHLSRLVAHVRTLGFQVVDLAPTIEELGSAEPAETFRPRGHLSPAMNQWVAERVSEALAAPASETRDARSQ